MIEIGRGDWYTKVETFSTMESTKEAFVLKNEVIAYEGEEEVFRKTWHKEIERDHM